MTTGVGTSASAAIVLSDPPVPTTATPTTVTPSVTPSVTIAPASTTTEPSTTRPLIALPNTGGDQSGILLIAFTLLALGAIAVRASRRRV
jgi:LPXTG-motif cell wall-anchored protein